MPAAVSPIPVVVIFKEGDSSKFENYRPISLLNTTYKIMAAMIKSRIEEVIDPFLQDTQFGFRKTKSTVHAIQAVRRLAEMGEAAGKQIISGLGKGRR